MTFPYKLIDLTHTIDEHSATWTGDCGFKTTVVLDYAECTSETQFRVMQFHMNAGIGTHIDTPSHCVPSGKTVSDLSLNDLCMPCVVIDVSEKAHERYSVTVDDIAAFESVHGAIISGSCVLIRTGWGDRWREPERYRNNLVFPSISAQAAQLLIDRGVYALGIDTLSPDRPEDKFVVHRLFLGDGKILIENIANAEQMPAVGGFVMILPIKIKGATEAPVRLVGLVDLQK